MNCADIWANFEKEINNKTENVVADDRRNVIVNGGRGCGKGNDINNWNVNVIIIIYRCHICAYLSEHFSFTIRLDTKIYSKIDAAVEKPIWCDRPDQDGAYGMDGFSPRRMR